MPLHFGAARGAPPEPPGSSCELIGCSQHPAMVVKHEIAIVATSCCGSLNDNICVVSRIAKDCFRPNECRFRNHETNIGPPRS